MAAGGRLLQPLLPSRAVRALVCGTLRTDPPALRPWVAGHVLRLAKESGDSLARRLLPSRAARALVCDTLRTDAPAPWPRAATYFLCLAKESRQRKARPLRRPLRGSLALLVRGGGRRTRHDRALRARHVPQTAAPLFSASDCAAQRLRGQGRKGSTLPPALSLSRERETYTAERQHRHQRSRPRGACHASTVPSPRSGEGQRGAWLDLPAIEAAEQRSRGGGFRRKSALALFRRPPRRAAQGSRVAAGIVGAPFFAYFLWQDKESRWPRGHEAERSSEAGRSPSASAASTASKAHNQQSAQPAKRTTSKAHNQRCAVGNQ
jgi:hypothetical protein